LILAAVDGCLMVSPKVWLLATLEYVLKKPKAALNKKRFKNSHKKKNS
jgi:hypothetical protein